MNLSWPEILARYGAQTDAAGNLRFDPPHTGAAPSLIPLLDEASLWVQGADATSFLQGQLTNDIQQVGATSGQLATYCTAKGRVLATFYVWPHDNGYVLRLPAELADAIRKRLRMYVLRAQVVIEDISDRLALLGLTGARSVPSFEKVFGSAPKRPGSVVGKDGMRAMALPGDRVEIEVPREQALQVWEQLIGAGCTPGGEQLWKRAGIAAGIATVLSATSDQFVPQMLNLELSGAVSFAKGCYPGQEIVARSQYLGQVKRRLRRFQARQVTQPGAPVFTLDGAAAGTVINVALISQAECELLAVVPRDIPATRLRLDANGIPLEELPLPYSLPAAASEQRDDVV
jgi:hypothetical protein